MTELALALCLFSATGDCALSRPSPWWRAPRPRAPISLELGAPPAEEHVALHATAPAAELDDTTLSSLGSSGLRPLAGGVDGIGTYDLDALQTSVVATATVVVEHGRDGGAQSVRLEDQRGCGVALASLESAAHGVMTEGRAQVSRWRGVVREHRTAPSLVGCFVELGHPPVCGSHRTVELRPGD